ncbi:MAG: isoprenylcysteine carboxylmethyltransferase family protein [bacterium]|nr:isoprenylcysteine carboxylmethyltransferase family protein [bacterium]
MELAARILDVLAGLMLAALPAALLFWLLIHPFASFWRRLGPVASYTIVAAICLLAVYAIWTVRAPLMRQHFGYRPITIGMGVALYLAGAAWDWRVLRKLRFPVLAGLPELSSGSSGRLLTDGPYGIVRHPRYFGALIGITGFALICNYLWVYVVVAASVPVGWLMIVLEERELMERFGSDYERYRRRVPCFVPRRTGERVL